MVPCSEQENGCDVFYGCVTADVKNNSIVSSIELNFLGLGQNKIDKRLM